MRPVPEEQAPRIALVTGANRGIGLAVAEQLGRLGLRVLVGARDGDRGKLAAAALGDDGIDAFALTMDVTDDTSVRAAAALIAERHGRLDVLVNNAGIKLEASPSPPSGASLDDVRATLDTNVLGTIRVTLAMLGLLHRSDAPRVVNVSSSLGSLGLATTSGSPQSQSPLLGYNVSKSAINAVTVQFANELRDTAFKVNAADPGYTRTGMTEGRSRPTDRLPADAAAVVVRLATLAADGPTGGFFDHDGEVPW
jgi:NAD(P)-dependent dehydrogenase (short-subunit alcohol dehydrogenase family)